MMQFITKEILKNMIIGIIIALIAAAGAGAAVADSAMPGERLYAVDRAVERISLNIAPPQIRQRLRRAYAKERMEEARAVLANEPKALPQAIAEIKETERELTSAGDAATASDVRSFLQDISQSLEQQGFSVETALKEIQTETGNEQRAELRAEKTETANSRSIEITTPSGTVSLPGKNEGAPSAVERIQLEDGTTVDINETPNSTTLSVELSSQKGTSVQVKTNTSSSNTQTIFFSRKKTTTSSATTSPHAATTTAP